MRITDVSMESFRWPRTRPIRNGMFVYTHVELSLIRVESDAGITGIAPGVGGPVGAALLDEFRGALIGQDPMNVERIWHALWIPKLFGRRGTETRIISGIDIAVWDLVGRYLEQPVCKLLGGFHERVPVYIAGGYYEEGKGLDDLAQEMTENVEMGATAVKMKVGGDTIAADVERVRVAREAVGPGVELMVDANGAYRAHEAIRLAKQIEPYDIYWFEEPCGADDYAGHGRVAAATSIPIATGENEYTRYGYRDLIEHKAAAILQPDANIMGGVTEYRKVADLAAAYDLALSPHGAQEVHIHLVAGVPAGMILEYYRGTVDPLWDTKFEHTLKLDEDGMLAPPDRPGFGIEPNYEALEPYRVG